MRETGKVIQNHDNMNVQNIGKSEAQQRKYKMLELGGGQT